MQQVEWRSELNTGIEQVDHDHRHLIDLTNQLIDAIEKDASKEEILNLFDALESYTVYHFNREESHMDKHTKLQKTRTYIKHHKAQHRYFIQKISEFKDKLLHTTDKASLYDIAEFLLRWLLDHIIKEDLRINQFIQYDKEENRKYSYFLRIGKWIKNHTTLHQRFLLILAIPLLFLTLQSTLISYKAYNKYLEYEKIQKITNSIININSNIIQLQRERGLSSAYIASGYKDFRKELFQQRENTSQTIQSHLDTKELIKPYTNTTEAFLSFQKLHDIRKDIDNHKLNIKQNLDYYTHFINMLIQIIKELSYLPLNTIDEHSYSSLLLMMHINEIDGLIRNEGITCLVTEIKQCDHLSYLYSRKKTYEQALSLIAPSTISEEITILKNSKETQHTIQIYQQLFQKKIHGHSAADQWFKKISNWIDQYNAIITKHLQRINHDALIQKETYFTIIKRIWLASLFMALFIAISIYLLKKSIIEPIGRLTNALHKLSIGNKRIFFHTFARKDAISKMEYAYNQLRNSLIQADYTDILIYLQEMKTQTYAKLSEEDALTGIYNRRAFIKKLQLHINKSEYQSVPFSLLLLDIDHFKKINDTYGHDTGDYILQSFSEAIKTHIREGNDIFARVGGEEFALLLPDTLHDTACSIAKKLIETIASIDFKKEDSTLNITISIGVASYSKGSSAESLIQEADKLLYKAKNEGRNRAFCS